MPSGRARRRRLNSIGPDRRRTVAEARDAADRLAQQLGSSLTAPGNGGVFRAILTLLAEGAPVPKVAVARSLGRLDEDAAGLLAQIPSLEFDDAGDIVGAGLSLRPTAHLLEIGGRRLYTWCALDTLIFPAMLGRSARVTSPCAATGTPVRLVVGPEEIDELDPASAVVSLHLFEGTRDVRSAFCRDVNFFVSEDSAAEWLHTHPDGWVLPVARGHSLARDLASQLANGVGPTCC